MPIYSRFRSKSLAWYRISIHIPQPLKHPMIIIRPFAALRPQSGLESKIASRPYDVLSSEEARQEAKGNEKSFYRVIKPEINLDSAKPSTKGSAICGGKKCAGGVYPRKGGCNMTKRKPIISTDKK